MFQKVVRVDLVVLIGVWGFSVELSGEVSVLHVSRVVLDQFINVLLSELDLHAVRFGCQRGPKDGRVVWLPCVLRPYKLELAQQRNDYKEELHTCKTLSKTHTGT